MPGNETVHTIPNAALVTFQTLGNLFWDNELPAVLSRYMPGSFVRSGGLHATAGSRVSAAFPTEAFTELGNRVTADNAGGAVSIDYGAMGASGTVTCWTIISAQTSNSLGNFQRVGSSNYFVNVGETPAPTLPADSAWLMEVTITANAITAVTDKRVPVSYVRSGVVSITDPLYGANPLGTSDASPAVSTAAQAAIMLRSALYVPGTPVGYRIDTPINLTNLAKSLTIYGDGINGITYGAALEPLNGGSLFLGNTGTGKAVFDCAGSSNLLFRGINITSLAQSTPSTIGILFGTSTTAVALQAPGGASCSLENVSIQLQNANNSVPVYFAGGAGLSHFQHVWTLGVHGIYLTANNELALSSEYVTLGPVIGVAGVKASGCNLLGYGGAPVLSLEVAHNQRWSQTYLATIFGGPAYAGQPYACKVKDSIDVKIEMEVDYFPTPLLMDGDCRNCHFFGSTFPHATPLGASDGIIAFFAGEVLRNCHFWITPSLDDAPVNNYHYTTNGVTASMVAFQSCTFLMDSAQSTFIAFLNATDDIGVPFFNLSFDGDADVGTYDFRVDGVSAGEETKRYFINGVLFGSA